MLTIADIRQKHPEYNDMSDVDLADSLHRKFYSDLPKEKVYEAVGLQPQSEIAPSPFNAKGTEEPTEAAPEQTGFKALLSDTLKNLGGSLKGGVGFVRGLPDEFEKSNKLSKEHNIRAVGEALAGVGEFGKSAFNATHDLSKFLTKHLPSTVKIPGTNKHISALSDLIPHLPEDMGIERALGLDKPVEGRKLIRALPDIASVAVPSANLISKGINAVREGKALKALDATLETAKEEHNLSKEQVQLLEDKLRDEFSSQFGTKIGGTEPISQRENANVKKHKAAGLENTANLPIEHVPEAPEAPDTKALVTKASEDINTAKTQLGNALEHGKEHARHGGKIIGEALEKLRKSGNKMYEDIKDTYKTASIPVDNADKVREVKSAIDALQAADKELPGYAFDTPEVQALSHHMTALENETISAADVLDTYRTLEKKAADARDSVYGRKLNEEQKTKALDIAHQYKQQANKLAEILEETGDPEMRKNLKDANQVWRKFTELRDVNPISRNVLKEGKLPPNTLTKLTGTTAGNEFLNALVGNSKDLKKWILGQSFEKESSFNRLLNPHENVAPYLKDLSKVQDHVNAFRDALSAHKDIKASAAEIETEHKALVKALGEKAAEQAERMVAKEQHTKLLQEVAAHEKAEKALTEKISIEKKRGNDVKVLERELKARTKAREETLANMKKLVKYGLYYSGYKSVTGHH